MNKIFISLDKLFNKILIISFLVFIGFVLAGCTSRQNNNTMPSNARIEYQNMQVFKQKNESFYKQIKQ